MTNSTAGPDFYVVPDQQYRTWVNDYARGPFPYFGIAQAQSTIQTVLTFTPDNTGAWDVVVVNYNPIPINIAFTPA